MASPEVTQLLRDRALVRLRIALRTERNLAVHGRGQPDGLFARPGWEGGLLALERIGAITGEEAVHWRERLRDAAGWRPPEDTAPSAEVVRRAEAHFESLLAQVSPSSRQESDACFHVITVYELAGALGAGEAMRWRERVCARLGVDGERPPRSSYRSLVRVVPGPARRIHGFRITSAELYEDGVILRWHESSRRTDDPDVPRVWSFDDMDLGGHAEVRWRALTDDAGTRYFGHAQEGFGINGGGWTVRFGETPCTPAVPAHARRLRVLFGGDRIDIDL